MAALRDRKTYREKIMRAVYEAAEGSRLLGVDGVVIPDTDFLAHLAQGFRPEDEFERGCQEREPGRFGEQPGKPGRRLAQGIDAEVRAQLREAVADQLRT